MTEGPKRDHAKVWAMLQEHFGPRLQQAGFNLHPAFLPGYEPSNRMWQCSYIGMPAPDGIRAVNLAYAPHDRCWFVTGYLYACADAAERIPRLEGSSFVLWFDPNSALRWRRTDLNPSSGWAFWRPARIVSFNEKTGEPVRLEPALQRATRALPAFLAELTHPGDPLRDTDFFPRVPRSTS